MQDAAPTHAEVVANECGASEVAAFVDAVEVSTTAGDHAGRQIAAGSVIGDELVAHQAWLQAAAAVSRGAHQVGALTALRLVAHGPAGTAGVGGCVKVRVREGGP